MKNTKLKLIPLLLLFFTGFNACKKESLISSNGTYSTATLSKKDKLDLNGKAGLTLSDGQELKNFDDLDEYIKTYGLTDEVNNRYFYFDEQLNFRRAGWDNENNQPYIVMFDQDFYPRTINGIQFYLEKGYIPVAARINPALLKDRDLEVTIYGNRPTPNPVYEGMPPRIGGGGGGGASSGNPGSGGSSPAPAPGTPPSTPSDPPKKPKPLREYWKDKLGRIIAYREAGTQDWISIDQLNEVTITSEKNLGNNVFGILISSNAPTITAGGSGGSSTTFNIIGSGPTIDPKEENKCFDVNQSAELTVYVQQGKEKTRDLVGPNEVGHVFVGIKQGGIERYYGFYPEKGANSAMVAVGKDYKSELRDNSGEMYHVSISKPISNSELASIINYANNPPKTYNVNDYACTDFGIAVGKLGGINLPSTKTSSLMFNGTSPGNLGEDIRSGNFPNTTKTTTKYNAPKKKGGCN